MLSEAGKLLAIMSSIFFRLRSVFGVSTRVLERLAESLPDPTLSIHAAQSDNIIRIVVPGGLVPQVVHSAQSDANDLASHNCKK